MTEQAARELLMRVWGSGFAKYVDPEEEYISVEAAIQALLEVENSKIDALPIVPDNTDVLDEFEAAKKPEEETK